MDKKSLAETHILYHFNSCPFCLKVRVTLKTMGIKIPLRNIKSNPEYRNELSIGGGKKQVPCLRITQPDGTERWLYESDAIIRYFKGLA